MKSLYFILTITLLCNKIASAQPFVDVVNFSYQTFSAHYRDNESARNRTDDYFLRLNFPKEFKNGNALLTGLNGEIIHSKIISDSSYSANLANFSLSLGFQFVSKNKKWKTVATVIPKIASNFKDAIDGHDFQLGGLLLETFVPNDKLKFKLGMYYNREAFGNLFIPFVGVDWRPKPWLNLYGLLPAFYRVEFNILKNRIYTGVGFKTALRSFRLSKEEGHDYVRYQEGQIKVFLEGFIAKNVLLYAEAGYNISRNPLQYRFGTKEEVAYNPIYTRTKPYAIFNMGVAYRIRLDLEK